MTDKQLERTRGTLDVFVSSSLFYLAVQQLLNCIVWTTNVSLQTFTLGATYFFAPAISAILVAISYFGLRHSYTREGAHYLVYGLSWVVLLIPQMVPPFVHGLNIIYTTWTFIMATSATGAVIFRDLALPEEHGSDREALKFVFDELKFYLDRMSFAWVALGTITGVAMTILWQGQGVKPSFEMRYEERVLWAVYMLLGFITVSLIVAIFAGFPLYKRLLAVRRAFVAQSPSAQSLVGQDREMFRVSHAMTPRSIWARRQASRRRTPC